MGSSTHSLKVLHKGRFSVACPSTPPPHTYSRSSYPATVGLCPLQFWPSAMVVPAWGTSGPPCLRSALVTRQGSLNMVHPRTSCLFSSCLVKAAPTQHTQDTPTPVCTLSNLPDKATRQMQTTQESVPHKTRRGRCSA